MKKIELLLILVILAYPNVINSQTLLLEENFNFSGNLTDNGWTAHNGVGTNPIGTTTGLSYSSYVSSDIGNAALLDNNGEDVNRSFNSLSTGNIFVSFLVNVTSSHTTITEGYVLHLRSGSTHFAKFYVDYESSSGNIALGIGQTTGTSAALKTSFSYIKGTTYLIIMKYTFVVGDLNDAVQLWVLNSGVPSSESNAGSPTIGPTTTTTEGGSIPDPTSIDDIALRQYNLNQNVVIDGIRISDNWSQAPLPVELTSFSASVVDDGIKLNWRTETEVNNYGFEILRFAKDDSWSLLGFVEGNGNSNSPKEYSFIDDNVSSGKYAYRLKQIDNDGTFEFSKVIEIDVDTPLEFELSQNYPNPFNPSTTIKFSLPFTSNVKLSVFNILGEEIQILLNETKEAGIHTINFSASQLNSGIYFYKLETRNFLRVKKMSLIR